MKHTFFKALCVLFTALFTLMPNTGVAGETQPAKDQKVAAINGTIITGQDVARKVAELKENFARQGRMISDEQLPDFRKYVINGMIEEEILFQDSQAKKIKVDQDAVKEALGNIRKGFPSEAEFDKALATNNMTQADLKQRISRDYAIRQLIDTQIADKVQITDQEGKSFYKDHPDYFKTPEQVKASHILVKLDENANESDQTKAQTEIKDIQKQLKDGKVFSDLAREHSDCPSKEKGGDLGFFGRGQMVGPFEDAAFSLKVGETSDIVKTKFGYHLIKVTEKQSGGTVSYADSKEKIMNHLKREKVNENTSAYIEKLKQNAKIEMF